MSEIKSKEVTILDLVKKIITLFKFLFSKWVIILCVGFISGICGIVYAWMSKPVYTAEMSFTTETESGGKLNAYAGIAAQFGFDIGGGASSLFEGDNLVELLKSKTLIVKTLLSPSGNGNLLVDEYLKSERLDPSEEKIKFDTSLKNNTRLEDSILNNIYKSIVTGELNVARRDKKLSIIVINIKGTNEFFCKRFVEQLATNAIQFYTDYKSRKARQNVEILQRQTDSVRLMLFGSISDVATITDLNVNPTKQSLKIPSQKRQIDVQVNGTLYGELLKNLELSKLALRKETPLIQVIDTPRFPLDRKKPGRLMTGILWAVLGGILIVSILLIQRYIKNYKLIFGNE